MDKYPRNSKLQKGGDSESPQSSRRLEKVVTGSIIKRRKPLLARIFGETTGDIGNYIVWDILVPVFKSTITDIITNSVEMLFYGEARSRSIRRDRNRSFVSYSGYYKDRESNRDRGITHNRSSHRFDDIIMESRGEAEEVLSLLVDQIEEYGVATVADFYDLTGLTSEFTDHKWGWENLAHAQARRVREGYILDMPKPERLD